MIGGEGEANPIWMKYGAWIDYAQKLGAYCIQLEHRFYGKSHPTRLTIALVFFWVDLYLH